LEPGSGAEVKVMISGPIDVNGVLYTISTQANLTITGGADRYIVYLSGSGDSLTPTLLAQGSEVFDNSKNARYYSGYRVLNWIVDYDGADVVVSRWLDIKQNAIILNDLIIGNDLIVENDLIVDGNYTEPLKVTDTTASSSKDTGCGIFQGGIGVEEDIYAGADIRAGDDIIAGDNISAGDNITAGKYLDAGLGRLPTGFYHSASATENSVFDAISSSIPNINDEVIVNGGRVSASGLLFIISKIVKTASNQITLYGVTFNGSSGSATTLIFTDGDTGSTFDISIAW
jgi:hypothetical protein